MSERDELSRTQVSVAQGKGESTEQLPVEQPGRYAVPEGVSDPELGRGGMGRVLTLYDTHLKREVAVKELLSQHTASKSSSGPLLESLFVREARVLALLDHPGVVPVHELGRRPDGTPYYTMRRIRGRSLLDALKQTVSLDERLSLLSHFIDVAQTVGHAHSKGVVHRDLKPENVMVGGFGETQVIDWGLALVAKENVEGLTVAGTPAYMSPEAVAGQQVDARSDVWSLGVMLFELLTGTLPFDGATGPAVLEAVRVGSFPKVRALEPQAPPALVAVVDKALQREPSQRYPNAGALADALEAAQRARAPRPWALYGSLAVSAVTALALGGLALSLSSRGEDLQRDARLAVVDAQHSARQATVESALRAWRDRDSLRASQLAETVAGDPLARGLSWLVTERGAPERLWAAKVEAGCTSVAVSDDTVVCATLNGLELWSADGRLTGTLTTGPRGWQHAVLALTNGVVVAGGEDRRLTWWHVATRKEVRHVEGFSSPIRSLALSGDALVVGLVDGSVMRVEPDDRVTLLTKHPRAVTRLAALPGLVASVSDNLLRVVGDHPVELDRHVGAVVALDAHALAIGVERSVVWLRDGAAGQVGTGHLDDVSALVRVPPVEGTPARLVSGGDDGTVRWWFEDGTLEGVLGGFAPGVRALAVTDDGRLVVTTISKALEVWRLPPRQRVPPAVGVPSAYAWWPGGGLVTGYRDGHVRRLDPQSGELHDLEARHTAPVRAVARVPGDERSEAFRFLSASEDGRVLGQRWNGSVETLDALAGARILALAVNHAGDLAAWTADDGSFVLWNLSLDREVTRRRDTAIRALAFAADDRVLLAGSDDRHLSLFDGQTGAQQRTLDPLDAPPHVIAVSADGKQLAAGLLDGRVVLVDIASAKVTHTFTDASARISSLNYRSDGVLLAAGSDDGAAYVFSPPETALVAKIPVDASDVLLVAFVDEVLLVIGSDRVVHALHPL